MSPSSNDPGRADPPDPGSEQRLLNPVRRGSSSAVVALFERYAPWLRRRAIIDLAFIERNRPTRNYRVRWHGVWFSPRAKRVDFHAGADDGVILRVDGDTVLERSPAVGMHAGAHRDARWGASPAQPPPP